VRYEWNRDVFKGTGLIILLKVPLEEIIKRVQVADRPRVNIGTTLEEDVRRIWGESKEKYYNAADIIYETSQKSIEEEVEELQPIISDYLGVP
jgi:shikimate kinase